MKLRKETERERVGQEALLAFILRWCEPSWNIEMNR